MCRCGRHRWSSTARTEWLPGGLREELSQEQLGSTNERNQQMGSINPPGREPVYRDEVIEAWIAGWLGNPEHDSQIGAQRLLTQHFRKTPGMHCAQDRFHRLVAKVRAR